MAKKITLLGSTGSIGTQSLDVIRAQGYEVFGLSAHSQTDKILQQIEEFHPKYVCMTSEAGAEKLSAALAGRADAPRLLTGPEGLKALAAMDGPDVVLNSVVGIAGLGASLAAIESGHDLALANKESLVTGGHLVTDAVKKYGVKLLPVAPPPATTVDRVIEAVPEVVDKVTEFWEKQQEKKGQPDPDVVE